MYRQISKPKLSYNSHNFSLILESEEQFIKIAYRVHHGKVNTRDFPETLSILKKDLPSVLNTKCFNKKNLSFKQEVVETEVAHLFEHLLLEYLRLIKKSLGEDIVINGKTYWDWYKDPRGLFHIVIDFRKTEQEVLDLALAKAIGLMEKIFNYKVKAEFNSLNLALEE